MKIIENAITPILFNKMQKAVMGQHVPWYYSASTAFDEQDTKNTMDYSWYHIVMSEGNSESILAPLIESSLISALENANQDISEIIRIRIGLITATQETIIHDPHVDWDEAHKTGILYLNNSDGDTYIYNEMYDVNSSMNSKEYIANTKLSVYDTSTPQQNKLVLINGLQYHASSTPVKTGRRVAINFNYR